MIHPPITDAERAKDALIESLSREVESLVARLAAATDEAMFKDAARYRHMRNSAEFRRRNGPGLYW